LAQSSGMLIELIMLSAVVMVGIALLVSDPIKTVYSIAKAMKVMVRAHLTTRSGVGRPLAAAARRCAIGRSTILDFRSPSRVHRRISRLICERVSYKHFREAMPKPLHAPKESYSIPAAAFEDVRDTLQAHNRRVLG
jgi:hypothetical protein